MRVIQKVLGFTQKKELQLNISEILGMSELSVRLVLRILTTEL